MIKLYLILAIIGILATTGTGAFIYVSSLQSQVATLQVNNSKLESAVATQQQTIKQQASDMAKFQKLNSELQSNLQAAEAGLTELRQTLANHDLTKLVIAKPGLIEKRINDATKNIFNQIQADTNNTPVPVDNSAK